MEFLGSITITVTDLIYLAGFILLACWLLKTSLGRKALADSAPRQNNMPLYLPFIPLVIWFGAVSLAISISNELVDDLQDWQSDFLDNLILCIGGLTTTAVIIFLARPHFARRLKGFGLNIRTVHKDFFAAFVNLLTIWPLMMVAITLTIFFGKLIWGQEYQIQQHQELELITQYSQLPLRILIVVVAIVIAPVLEEMLFRGLVQTMIRSFFETRNGAWPVRNEPPESTATPSVPPKNGAVRTSNGAWLAILISSGLFAIVHANPGHWPALFVLAVCLGYSYEKSGSLFRPIFIHALFNATSIIAVLSQYP
ncbi:MAG: lysostaphin resistance A-like protein [Planctomycetota bacterium]|jgi:membrane protease YdiL (CAAX protease family)